MRRNGGGACETLKKLRTQKNLEDLKIEKKKNELNMKNNFCLNMCRIRVMVLLCSFL